MRRIDSPANPLVKTLKRLAHPRKREDRLLLEGKKLVDAAIASGTVIETIVVSSTFAGQPPSNVPRVPNVPVVELAPALFRTVSTLESPDGVLAIATRPAPSSPTTGLVAVAVGIQDPGNLGALARVVEASGADGLIVVKGTTDPYAPKALRGSMGSVLRIAVGEISNLGELDGFHKVALVPRGGEDYRDADWSRPVALVLGSESAGLDDDTSSACDTAVTIPMRGLIESLNVATAAALVLYEATRRED